MRRYVAGADGGGTKTMLALLDMDGKPLGRRQLGALNANGQSAEQTRQVLAALVQVMAQAPGGVAGCAALCIATAGISNPDARGLILTGLEQLGYGGPVLLAGDQEAALQGAMGKAEGIILIAGTGSICFGKNAAGQSARSGGWGYLIDDGGSGYAIGRDILAAVVRAHDGRIAPTCLTQLVFEALNITDISQLIRFVYAPDTGKGGIARLAPLLSTGLSRGDAQCGEIVQHAARELAALAVPVAKKLGLQNGDMALCGSVLQKNRAIADAVVRRLGEVLPYLNVIAPLSDAADGAAQMALSYAQDKEE